MNASESGRSVEITRGGDASISRNNTSSSSSTNESVIRRQTPARVFVGRSGPAYRTATQLELRCDHAAARDAVHASLDVTRDFDSDFHSYWRLFTVSSAATSKHQYLLRPDLGRILPEESRATIVERCPKGVDFQVAIGDGLSALAVIRQVPTLLPALFELVRRRNWTWGQPFVIQHCRVGILNEIGACLHPKVAVLLIGERPGLAKADSLSAYMAYLPQIGQTDAHRNLISNIHVRGVPIDQAAERIVHLAAAMIRDHASGVALKEEWTPLLDGE